MSPGKKLRVLKKQYEDCWKYPPPQNDVKIDKYVACNEHPPSDGKGVRVNQPCWLSPGMSSNVRYGPCWDYPPQRFKRFPLPPPCRGSTLPVSALIPNFDKCISHYTRYDFTLEKCVHEQILVVESQLRNMERQLAATKEVEISLAKIMREQAIRRRLLIGSACGIKIYPEYLSQIAENDAMCSFQHCYNTLNSYNDELSASLVVIRDSMSELRIRFNKLDKTLESPFLSTLETVFPTIQHLYEYFFEVIRKFKTWAQLIDVGQEHSVEDYLALLRADTDFESFKNIGSLHCTCKRCRNKDHLDTYVPCWCQGCDRSKKNINLLDDDFPGFIDINPQLKSSDTGFEPDPSTTSLLQMDKQSGSAI